MWVSVTKASKCYLATLRENPVYGKFVEACWELGDPPYRYEYLDHDMGRVASLLSWQEEVLGLADEDWEIWSGLVLRDIVKNGVLGDILMVHGKIGAKYVSKSSSGTYMPRQRYLWAGGLQLVSSFDSRALEYCLSEAQPLSEEFFRSDRYRDMFAHLGDCPDQVGSWLNSGGSRFRVARDFLNKE